MKDTGTAAIGNWTLAWTFGGDQKISNMWGATATQTGEQVSAAAAAYQATIPAGGTAGVGFTATFSTANPNPTAFTVNGTAE